MFLALLLLPGPPSLQQGLLPHMGCSRQAMFVDPLKTVMPELYDDVESPIWKLFRAISLTSGSGPVWRESVGRDMEDGVVVCSVGRGTDG